MTQSLGAVTFLVHDYDEAIRWFADCLGFQLVADKPLGDGKRWVLMAPNGSPGARLLLARAEGANQQAAIGQAAGGRVAFILYTDDFARDHKAMLAAGVRFREPPRDEAYGTVAVFEDLCGNGWDLIQPEISPSP